MKPAVRVFSKDSPCTKRHLWECFVGTTGFRTVSVTEAHAAIGVNAPRGMERMGRLRRVSTPQGDYYTLTVEGRAWLSTGISAYVKNHPLEKADIPNLEHAVRPAQPVRIRRTR